MSSEQISAPPQGGGGGGDPPPDPGGTGPVDQERGQAEGTQPVDQGGGGGPSQPEQQREKGEKSKPPQDRQEDQAERILSETMVCPVCLVPPRASPCYLCPNGHLVCGLCQPRLKACPTCRARNIQIHNRPLEEYLDRQVSAGKKFPCKNSVEGCEENGTLDKIIIHELECHYRAVPCPGKAFNKCNWMGCYNKLLGHITQEQCSLLVKLEETNRAKHTFPELTDMPSIFGQNQKVSWKPTSYVTKEGLIFAYMHVRREFNNEWYLTCHCYAGKDKLDLVNVECTLQSSPIPHSTPTGASLPDHLAPDDLRPRIEAVHSSALRVYCYKPSVLSLVIHGKEGDQVNSAVHQGFCCVSVTSKRLPDPLQVLKGETCYTYKGPPLPPTASMDEIRNSGRFLCLKDEQLKHLGKNGVLFNVSVDYGVTLNQKVRIPAGQVQQLAEAMARNRSRKGQDHSQEGASPAARKDRDSPAAKRRCTTVAKDHIVVSKVVIPWKGCSSQSQGKKETTDSQDPTRGATMPLTTIIPIYPSVQHHQEELHEAVRRSHLNLHGK